MNSVQGYKGFITFALLVTFSFGLLIGYQYIINKPTQTHSNAGVQANIPTDVYTTKVTDSSATVSWNTKFPDTNTVYYSDNEQNCLNKVEACKTYKETTINPTHTVTLNDLSPATIYYYRIETNTGIYPSDTTYSFKTNEMNENSNKDKIDKKSNAQDNNNNITKDDSLNTDNNTETKDNATNEKNTNTENNINDSQDQSADDFDGIQPTQNTQSESKNADQSVNQSDDYDGFETSSPVLGVGTVNIDEIVQDEFKTAMKYNDSNYDFNHDGIVDDLDYPLFIYFVTSE